MGMASSQARLLSLTSRQHDVEWKAQKLQAEKLQMANESDSAYNTYMNALDAKKIQLKKVESDGSANFIDANYTNLQSAGYYFEFKDTPGIAVDTTTKTNYDRALGDKNTFVALQTGRCTSEKINNVEITKNTDDNYYEIYTAEQLTAILKNNPTNKNIRLMADIDMTGQNFIPNNIVSSTFDGNGYSITGLTTSLFDYVTNSTVKNLSVASDITEDTQKTNIGILANVIDGSSNVSDISISGSINAVKSKQVGGLAGLVGNTATISNCQSNVDIVAKAQVGGLIGMLTGTSDTSRSTVVNCSSTGNITAERIVGGLIGQTTQNTTISNSSANCNITVTDSGDAFAGGFIGHSWDKNITIDSCSASGSIDAAYEPTSNIDYQSCVAGFIGCIGHHIVNVNAISDTNFLVQNSTSYTNITTNTVDAAIAGFVGALNAGTVKNCDALGTITANDGAITKTSFSAFAGGDCLSENTQLDDNGNKKYPGYANANKDIVGSVANCYTSDVTNAFNGSASREIDALTDETGETIPMQIDTPNNNKITVTPPTITTTVVLDKENPQVLQAGALFDLIQSKGGCYNQNNTGLTGEATRLAGNENNNLWLTNMIKEGMISMYKLNVPDKSYYETNVATDTELQEVANDESVKKAEADYEANMRKINRKETKIDTELSSLEAERTSIKTEQESLKTVIKDNVNLSFKLFS